MTFQGLYINKEHIDVYILQMDVDLSSLVLQGIALHSDHMKSCIFIDFKLESEVSEVKYIPHENLFESFRRSDPTFVPCEMNHENSYGQLLFQTIQKLLKRTN
jgi:hypothetical protein